MFRFHLYFEDFLLYCENSQHSTVFRFHPLFLPFNTKVKSAQHSTVFRFHPNSGFLKPNEFVLNIPLCLDFIFPLSPIIFRHIALNIPLCLDFIMAQIRKAYTVFFPQHSTVFRFHPGLKIQYIVVHWTQHSTVFRFHPPARRLLQ